MPAMTRDHYHIEYQNHVHVAAVDEFHTFITGALSNSPLAFNHPFLIADRENRHTRNEQS